LDEASEEGHGGDFQDGHEREEGYRVGIGEVVFAGARLNACGGDLVLEDSQVACFVIADLLNAPVRCLRHADLYEVAFGKHLDGLLVELEYDPFGGEKILPGKVVNARGTFLGWEDRAGEVTRKGPVGAPIVAVQI